MSVSLNPSNCLAFRRPLTTLVKQSLTITNNNSQPVAFKVKTTAPKLYCVRPNSGRVEPGESVDVSVMLQALKEEPPLHTKCKDKFLIQSTIITPDKEALPLHDLWASPETNEEGKVFQQKLRVAYLPAEGQIEEEDEPEQPSILVTDSQQQFFGTVRSQPTNGLPTLSTVLSSEHAQPPPNAAAFEEPAPAPSEHPVERESSYDIVSHEGLAAEEPQPRAPSPAPAAPAAPYPVSEVETTAWESAFSPPTQVEPVPIPPRFSTPPAPAPAPAPIIIHRENPVNEELYVKLKNAETEIEQLRTQLDAAKDAASHAPESSGVRRRRRAASDATSVPASDIGTMVETPEDAPIHQDGVPIQVVVLIAFGVFVTTYLFF